jgi:putative ABC transport system ATP-binding protein
VLEFVNREIGTIVAVITHNAAIAGMADRVVRVSSGAIAEIQRNSRRISPSELTW